MRIAKREKERNASAAVLLLVTFIEGQFKGWSKEEYLQEKPDELDARKNAHGLALSSEEIELYDCPRHSTTNFDRLYNEIPNRSTIAACQ